jgi:hypothetical protein
VLKYYRPPLISSVQINHPAGSAISAAIALARVKAVNLMSFLGSMKNDPPPELPHADALPADALLDDDDDDDDEDGLFNVSLREHHCLTYMREHA